MGRPTRYTPELADEICERLAAGETLRGICKDEHVPPAPTVREWVIDDRESFAERYARARGMGLDEIGEGMLEIADNTDDPAKARVQVDTRKWLLSKLRPDKYGDRITQVHENKEPVEFVLTHRTNEDRTDGTAD